MALLGILETAIGLAFIYLLLSMLCSGINEWLAHQYGRRGRCLRAGLLNLVPDRWAYLRLLSHPAVASLYRDMKGRIRHPAYVPADVFVTALTDVVRTIAANIQNREAVAGAPPTPLPDIRAAAEVCARHGYPIGKSILAIIERKPLDGPDDAGKRIAAWYEGAMERVGGWYKRTARFQLFLVGLVAAAALNVDSIAIARQLMHADSLRAMLVADAARAVESGPPPAPPPGTQAATAPGGAPPPSDLRPQAARLLSYPGLDIGYACLDPQKIADPSVGLWLQFQECWQDWSRSGWGLTLFKFLGWLITAFAVSQGAPFWFDLMNRFVNLRGAGLKPRPAAGPASPQAGG